MCSAPLPPTRSLVIVSYYGLRESLAGAAAGLEAQGWTVDDWPFLGRAVELGVTTEKAQPPLVEELCERVRSRGHTVVLVWCNGFSRASLADLRAGCPGIVLALFNWDDPWWWMAHHADAVSRAPMFDVVFTTCQASVPWYLRLGVLRAVFLPAGFDPDAFAGQKDPAYACDVSFVFTQYYDQSPFQRVKRDRLVAALAAAEDLDFRIYGPEGIRRQYGDRTYRGPLTYFQTARLFASSAINICVHATCNVYGYVNERAILVPGAGGTMLVDDVPGLSDVISAERGECILLDADDPVGQVRALLRDRHALRTIARAGHARVLACYTWDKWAATVSATLDEPGPDPTRPLVAYSAVAIPRIE